MQSAARIEVLLQRRQKILTGAHGVGVFGSVWRVDPCVVHGFVRGHSCRRVDGEAPVDEVARGGGDTAPVLEWSEGVVGAEDSLHLFQIRVSVEWCVAAEEEVSYYANGPDVASGVLVREGSFVLLAGAWGRTLACRGRTF